MCEEIFGDIQEKIREVERKIDEEEAFDIIQRRVNVEASHPSTKTGRVDIRDSLEHLENVTPVVVAKAWLAHHGKDFEYRGLSLYLKDDRFIIINR